MKRRLTIGVGVAAVLVGVLAIGHAIAPLAATFTGNASKLLCSDIFVGGREEKTALAQDFNRLTAPGKYIKLAATHVDYRAKTVRSSLFGMAGRTAIFRQGIGCTAAEGASVDQLRAQGQGAASSLPAPDPAKLWPDGSATLGDHLPAGVDAAKINTALDAAMSNPDPAKPFGTRAVVLVQNGRILAERYAPGFGPDTALISNSMAKSVTSALIGILVGQGKLAIDRPAPIAEWRKPGDPRGAITLDNLLRMSSGLEFDESYTKVRSDNTMAFVGGDLAGFSAAKPLVARPGTLWHYSTGTADILGRIVRETAGAGDMRRGFAFPRKALFDPIGMRTAMLEVDAKGNFIGGSFLYAGPRDYARLGLLYLNDGVWNGQRILPPGWVAYSVKPTPHTPPKEGYGAQFWLNTGSRPVDRHWPSLPVDTYAMLGIQGQYVMIIPSRNVVVVRLAQSEFTNWSMADMVAQILTALPSAATGPGA